MSLARLHDHASRFRAAIERCDWADLPTLVDFPRGSCGDVTLLLGTYLQAQGLGTFHYMLGKRGHGDGRCSHAWLAAEGVIIDITADQFPEITTPVTVAVSSDWHASWRGKAQHVADYRIFDPNTVARLGPAYRAIRAQMEAAR